MHKFTRFILLMISLFISSISFAQAQQVEMADTMRSNGKIYVVVAVCLTILVGLFLYVFSIDRKISNIEKEQ
jgi:K+-transporting ATPase A subunit